MKTKSNISLDFTNPTLPCTGAALLPAELAKDLLLNWVQGLKHHEPHNIIEGLISQLKQTSSIEEAQAICAEFITRRQIIDAVQMEDWSQFTVTLAPVDMKSTEVDTYILGKDKAALYENTLHHKKR